MNQTVLSGRLVVDPEIRYTQAQMAICRYRLAVDRPGKDKGTDFLNCVCFGKGAEFASKFLHKGSKIIISGRIQTGSYDNREGQRVYTTEIVVESHEFMESKKESERNNEPSGGFTPIREDATEELPFH